MSRCRSGTRDCCPALTAHRHRFSDEQFWEGCSERCVVTVLIIVNFVFLISGGFLVFLGCFMLSDKDLFVYTELLNRVPGSGPLIVLDKIPVVFIGVGLVIVVLSFLGCYGTCVESVCCLFMYTILLFLILSAELLAGTLCIVLRDKISLRLVHAMQSQILREYNKTALANNVTSPATIQVTHVWDAMQVKLHCCGAMGPLDYRNSAWFNHTDVREGVFVPPSCCVLTRWSEDYSFLPYDVLDENTCQMDAILYPTKTKSPSLNSMGCGVSAVRWLESNCLPVISVLCTVSVIQIVHFGLACSTLSRIRRSQLNYEWYEGEGYYG